MAKINHRRDELLEEMHALSQYNHTRFVEQREINKESIQKEKIKDELNLQIKGLEIELLEAVEENGSKT